MIFPFGFYDFLDKNAWCLVNFSIFDISFCFESDSSLLNILQKYQLVFDFNRITANHRRKGSEDDGFSYCVASRLTAIDLLTSL